MKRIIPIAILSICFACLTEEGADPGRASTFVRYINGGFDDQAQAVDETPDKGFIVLASTQITDNNVLVQRSKIKLIKTDPYGNEVWKTLYPAFADVSVDTFFYKGRDIIVEKDGAGTVTGYTIIGDSINWKTGVPYLYLMQTDTEGNYDRSKSLAIPNLQGQSIAKDTNGDYIVLAARSNATNDMVLAKFNQTDLSLAWSREYGGGESTNLTNLITDTNNNIFWGGTVNRGSETNMRFVTTIPDSETAFDPIIGLSEFNEETGGICFYPFGSRFALVGTTDENGTKDILYKQISQDGTATQFYSKIIGGDDTEEGNAICTTDDGGFLIIGTSGADEEKDYYLIKLNIFGDVTWSKIFGSKKADKGVSVMQSSDGSYVILGATTLGGLGSIMLMKTDANGNIK